MDNTLLKGTAEDIADIDSDSLKYFGHYIFNSPEKAHIVAACKRQLEGADGFDGGYYSALRIVVSGTAEGDEMLEEVAAYVRNRPERTMAQACRAIAEAPEPIMRTSIRGTDDGEYVEAEVDMRDFYVKRLRAMKAENSKPADQLQNPVEIAYYHRPIMVKRHSSSRRKYDLRDVYLQRLREERAAEMKAHGVSA